MKDEYYITLDIGGTRVKIGIFINNKLLETKEIDALSHLNLFSSLDHFLKEIEELLGKHSSKKNLAGIGFAFAGLVDTKNKKVISTNDKYSDSSQLNIENWVYENWGVPFFIDNDARMAAVGEWKYGAGRKTDDLIMVTLGTGIGTSAIIDGRLLRGKHYQAGCLGGHFIINVNGKLCNCGNYGCAEAYASSWAIMNRIEKAPGFKNSALSRIDKITYKKIFEAAQEKDPLVLEIIEESIDVWSATVINLIHAYDPEIVIMGGGILGSSDVIIPAIRTKVNNRSWTPWGKVEIKVSQLENTAALFGLNYCLQHEI